MLLRTPVLSGAGVLALAGGVLMLTLAVHEPARSRASGPSESLTLDQDGGPILGELIGRRYRVRITAGPDGPLYAVLTLDGRVIKGGLRAGDVARDFPEIDVERMQFGPDDAGEPLMLVDPG